MALLIPTKRLDRKTLVKETPLVEPTPRVAPRHEEAPDRGYKHQEAPERRGRHTEAPDAGYARLHHQREDFTRGRSFS